MFFFLISIYLFYKIKRFCFDFAFQFTDYTVCASVRSSKTNAHSGQPLESYYTVMYLCIRRSIK